MRENTYFPPRKEGSREVLNIDLMYPALTHPLLPSLEGKLIISDTINKRLPSFLGGIEGGVKIIVKIEYYSKLE